MSLTASDAAALNAGAQVVSAGLNYAATTNVNRKTRQYNREMYDKQKTDNLAFYELQKKDNLAHWTMQNDYNSPTSQMNRLKEAGLNPNLVYGASAPGNSSSAVQSSTVNSPTPGQWRPETPRIDLGMIAGSAINTYYDLKIRQAQVDNLKADNTIKLEQAMLLATENKQKSLDLGINQQWSASMREQQYRKLGFDTERTAASTDLLRNQTTQANLKWMLDKSTFDEKVKQSKLQTLGIEKLNQLRELERSIKTIDLQLMENGVQRNDPFYIKMMAPFIKDMADFLQN